ncbi:MAG: hypothetical protein IAF38_09035 [Bacteroidia bacterium]|nr:hypothetical protein [Bacteroidia bacterium]
MAKYLFLGINSLLIVFFKFFAGDDVTVKHNFPSSLAAGAEFTTEITITKGAINGFGKLLLELPEGITAEEVESKSGKFAFENKQAKIIWIQLPSEGEFVLKIKFKADKSASGLKNISGKFAYVVGNEKKQVDIPVHEITVTNTETAVVTNTNSGSDTASKFNTPVEPGAEVQVERKIAKDNATGNYKVEIKIKKSQIKGFAKYSDVLPDGLLGMKGVSTGNGNFKFTEKKATFIWATLPKEEEITASYYIKATAKFTENPKVNGTFSYLDNEQTLKVNASEEVVPIVETETVVATNTVVANTNTVVANTNTVAETNTVVANTNTVVANTNTVAETNTVVANTNTVVANTNTVVAETNTVVAETNTVTASNLGNSSVIFHIQIGAYNAPPQTEYFANKYNIAEPISTDLNNGLTKFLVGKFSDYKVSRDYREKIKGKGVSDAFVTAYNSGKRITVQEALMIAKQKWFR